MLGLWFVVIIILTRSYSRLSHLVTIEIEQKPGLTFTSSHEYAIIHNYLIHNMLIYVDTTQ